MSESSERLREEAQFHDQMVEKDTRWTGFRAYGLSAASIEYAFSLVGNGEGKVILDMGCGAGERTAPLLQPGVHCYAFDISQRMAGEADKRLRQIALARGASIACQQMAGEQMAFASNSVDIVFGISVLHHLDISLAFSEIKRVLKPGGRAIFVEPLNHHPIAKLYRRSTPARHSEAEEPLDFSFFRRVENEFSKVTHKEFYLFSLGAAVFAILKNKFLFDKALELLMKVDEALFSRFPRSRKFAWITVVELMNY